MEAELRLSDQVMHGEKSAFARRVGITPATLSSVLSGKRRPSVDLARRISHATGGAVTVRELLVGDEPALAFERWSPSDPEVTADDVLRSMGIQPPAPPSPPNAPQAPAPGARR